MRFYTHGIIQIIFVYLNCRMDNKKLWDSVLVGIELSLSKASFNTWFKDTYIARVDDGIVHLAVPNAFVKEWLVTKYHKTILKSLRELSDVIRNLEYIISRDDIRKKESEQARPICNNLNTALPLHEYYIDKENKMVLKLALIVVGLVFVLAL